MTARGSEMPPDQRLAFDLGLLHTEVNTILGRIRRRRSGEPTAVERTRLAELRAEIARLKRGGTSNP